MDDEVLGTDVDVLEQVEGFEGGATDIGSKPIRIRFAFWDSFSQA